MLTRKQRNDEIKFETLQIHNKPLMIIISHSFRMQQSQQHCTQRLERFYLDSAATHKRPSVRVLIDSCPINQ